MSESAASRVLPAKLPVLHEGPIVLRAFRDDDADAVREATSDPLIPLITTVPTVPDRDEVLAYIRRQQTRLAEGLGGSFAIATSDDDHAVGQIGLWPIASDAGRASVGYWVMPSARRRGIAREALSALSTWALSRPGLVRLELYVEPWNEGSWRAAEAADYRREGLLRSWQVVGDERRDMYVYARLSDDGVARPDRGITG